MTYQILYRGSLSSCNYGCNYCPFAKTKNTKQELASDAQQVNQFVDWVENFDQQVGVFFTPWGEALIHRYYRQAMIRLSMMKNVKRVCVQTNLSCRLDDFAEGNNESLAIWATFHPTETSLERFLTRCEQLIDLQISFSVGVVGLHEHFDSIAELRKRLPENIYLWVNSFKRQVDYYSKQDLFFLKQIDPYFSINCNRYPSRGKACRTGYQSFTVDGKGDVRRCHFVDQVIANIYQSDIHGMLSKRSCPNESCGCHIGYVYLEDLSLHELFGENILERIPATWPRVDERFTQFESYSEPTPSR